MENKKEASWAVVLNAKASNYELTEAIKDIGKSPSQIKFWNDIANNPKYTLSHRKHCVIQLFKRHGASSESLGEFIRLFLNEKWFEKSQFTKIDILIGKLPIAVSIDRSVFQIAVLPENKNTDCFIYFSVEGKVSAEQVSNMLNNDNYFSDFNKIKILEIGYAGDLLQSYNKPY